MRTRTHTCRLQVDGWGGFPFPLPAFSSNVAATLKVLDIRYCSLIGNIDSVRNCAQLTRIQMGSTRVSDLTPLASCTHLEEAWMAGCSEIKSIAPLAACPRLRKLDLSGCLEGLRDQQFVDLKAACTQLEDPSSVELEGLVHDLDPGIPEGPQWEAAEELAALTDDATDGSAQNRVIIAEAGAIPRLVELMGPGFSDRMLEAAMSHGCAIWLPEMRRTRPPSLRLAPSRAWLR
jgi:hypothetical protein